MTNVPLLCNICPKEPEFSDVSHLLTHVASKGHLSQHNKAKLRAHQDASLREKLQAYDRWYHRHQIERLLSERMLAKDSKDSGNRKRASRTNPRPKASTNDAQPRKRRTRTAKNLEQEDTTVKNEGFLDPRLSQPGYAAASPDETTSSLLKPPIIVTDRNQTRISPALTATTHQINLLNQPHHHRSPRAPIPRMSIWQEHGSPHRVASIETPMDSNCNPLSIQDNDTDGESDFFQTFLRSPTRTAYPDPSEVNGLRSGFSADSTSSIFKEDDMDLDRKDATIKKANPLSQSPVLRGVKWPGMSIFDSADLEAQRLRNQKKTEGIIEQMEHNSGMVEQMERIYWPDGSLKVQRVITGEVESSPPRELTPPPKPPKRRRTKATKTVLTDKSTNAPTLGKKPRTRKVSSRIPAAQASSLQSISHEALASLEPPKFVYPRSAHMGYDPPKEEESEHRLANGNFTNRRRRGFNVFNDPEEKRENSQPEHLQKMHDQRSARDLHVGKAFEQAGTSALNVRSQSRAAPRLGAPLQPHNSSYLSHSPFADVNNENIEPILDGDGRVSDEAAAFGNQRTTQRYFSVTGNQPPQFFNSMPPGMDFGGLMEPTYYGTTLNPLNSYLRQQQFASSQVANSPFSRGGESFMPSTLDGGNAVNGLHR